MLQAGLVKGTTIKFPLGLRFSVGVRNVVECSDHVEDIAITLTNGNYTVAPRIRFVPHAPGGINYAETNADVLSCFFTGCVMSTYTYNGARRVGHVHTGNDAGPNRDCKNLMRGLLHNPINAYRKISNFKPYDGARDSKKYTDIALQTAFGAQGCGVLGLVTSETNKCFSVFTKRIGSHEYLVEDCIDNTNNQYHFFN